MAGVDVQRIYDPPGPGHRVLVDRLWPRGVTKVDAHLDEWAKEVAPSTELRQWYGHDVDRFERFATRYRDELARPPAAIEAERLRDIAGRRLLVLLTATKDVDHSAAVVLRDVIVASSCTAG